MVVIRNTVADLYWSGDTGPGVGGIRNTFLAYTSLVILGLVWR